MIPDDDLTQLALDDLYGLHDAAEADDVQARLDTPAGRMAVLQAVRIRSLLNAAAKVPFPEARFQPPQTDVAPHVKSNYRWVGWVVAATVLTALSIPVTAQLLTNRRLAEEAVAAEAIAEQQRAAFAKGFEDWKTQRNQVREERDRAVLAFQTAEREKNEALVRAQQEHLAKQLNVVVSGPAAITPGAANYYQIETRDGSGQPTHATLYARVVDQANRVIYEPPSMPTKGLYRLSLPKDLPLTPERNLFLEVEADRKLGRKATVKQQLPLTAPVYLAHLTTDKPMYQPGETVRFRALLLDRFKLQPPTEDLWLSLTVLDPQGVELSTTNGTAKLQGDQHEKLAGLAASDYILGPSAPGGEYAVRLRESSGRTPEQVRKFLVSEYKPPQFQKVLEFSRKSYGPGDEVIAACTAARVNGPLAHQPVTASAHIDGEQIQVVHAHSTDSQGAVAVKFRLPKEIKRGEASVSVYFTDGATKETLSKPVPVVLNKINVEFFPEGGDLITGVPNRVYLQARSPLGRPAEMRGRILDPAGKLVAEVQTLNDDKEPGINQGQALIAFTPLLNQTYRLLVDRPAGIANEFPLPAVKNSGVVLNTGAGVTSDTDALKLDVTNVGPSRSLVVGTYARGRLLAHERVAAAPGQTLKLELQPTPGYGGITRVTVFEETGAGGDRQLVPVAERLVFRKLSKKLDLAVNSSKSTYAPGDRVGLKVMAKDENGRAVPAIAMLGVVNNSVVVMADEKTHRTMPTHFLLTSEVEKAEDLEHVDVLLGTHAKAEVALDLLLGVQGWRRFVEQGPGMPPAKDKAEAKLMVAHSPTVTLDTATAMKKEVERLKLPAVETARQLLRREEEQFAQTVRPPAELTSQLQATIKAVDHAVAVKREHLDLVADTRRTGRYALPWLGGLAGVLGFGIACVSLVRGRRPTVGSGGLLLLAIGAGVGWLALRQPPVHTTQVAGLSDDISFATTDRLEELIEEKLSLGRSPTDEELDLFFGGRGDSFRKSVDQLDRRITELAADRGTRASNQPRSGVDVLAAALPTGASEAKKDAESPPERAVPKGESATPLPPAPVAPADIPPAAKPAGPADQAKPAQTRGVADAQQPIANLGSIAKNPLPTDAKSEPSGRGGLAGRPGGGPLPKLIPEVEARARMAPGRAGGGGGRDGRAIREPDGIERAKKLNEIDEPLRPFVVRQYAHVYKVKADRIRDDFTETVYWHPALIVPDAGINVNFDLADTINRYQVLAAAHTLDGRLGAAKLEFSSRKPVTVEPKLPIEITSGDRMIVPVSVSNETDKVREVRLWCETSGLVADGPGPELKWKQAPASSTRRSFGFRSLHAEGTARMRFGLTGDDAIESTVRVVPEGFPIREQISGELRGRVQHNVLLPATWIPNTLKCEVVLFPTPLADLQRGLEGLLREPGGCFEQTSTTNYPNALILNYLQETGQANPAAVARAKSLLEKGYARLTSFEVALVDRRAGYEWFGHAPAHEALTAYGLLQFRDMARVTDVDANMLSRTSSWLLARRDGKGGFQRAKAALDSFGRASEATTNAYIVWAITEGGKEEDVTPELDLLAQQAKTINDPYFLALVANAMMNRDCGVAARSLLSRLVKMQAVDGSLSGNEKSITGSQGKPLAVETTALAILGWLKAGEPAEYGIAIRNAVKWLGQQRNGSGAFGPTQSTILALKALVAYARAYKQPPESGTMTLMVAGKSVASADYAADHQGAVVLEVKEPEKLLQAGNNEVSIQTSGRNLYPYTLAWSYQSVQPPSADACAVRLATSLDKSELKEGEATRLNVTLDNVTVLGQGMTVAIVGLPAGIKLPDDFKQLRDLARLRDGKPGPIAFWELRGRELVLYWRDLAPAAKVELHLDVIAALPGTYRGPASRAYLYYDPEAKHWTPPLAAEIK